MHKIGEDITNMGGGMNYINCDCITDVNGDAPTNLFDKDNVNVINGFFGNTGGISSSNTAKTIYISITGGKTYSVGKILSSRFAVGTTSTTPEVGTEIIERIARYEATNLTLKTSNNANYLIVYLFTSGSPVPSYETIIDTLVIIEE